MPIETNFCSSIIGAGIGGTLAEPVKNYPSIFSAGGIFDKYPFLLPNLVCTAVVIFGLLVGIFFLEETHEDKKGRRDIGLELGARFLAVLKSRSPFRTVDEKESAEAENLLFDEKSPRFSTTEHEFDFPTQPNSSRSSISDASTFCESTCSASTSGSDAETVCELDVPSVKEKLSWRQGFNRQVVLTVVGYGILALYVAPILQMTLRY